MKRLLLFITVAMTCVACVNDLDMVEELDTDDPLNLTDNVVIGKKLRNPYSIEVMKEACDLLYPPTKGETPASDSIIVPNVKYVRFLPADSTEFRHLSESGLELFNYPLDYEILGDPSDYHDPNLPPEQITWQYTVMPINQVMPIGNGEILDVGFIPDLGVTSGGIDLNAIDHTANELASNEFTDSVLEGAVGGGTNPNSGTFNRPRIQVFDHYSNTNKGVKGIKVRARNVWKILTAYTDSLGYYSIDLEKLGCYHPRFELRFENKYGFKIGYGIQLIMPITANMEGQNRVTYTHSANHKFWASCIINNAAHDWYKRCETEGMPTPPKDLYIWAMEIAGGAACPMFHHKTLQKSRLSIPAIVGQYFGFDNDVINFNILNRILELIAPDVVIFGVDESSVEELYRHTSHELSHATHFQMVGSNVDERALWWSDVIQYEVACGIIDSPYEATGVPHSGKVGVTEMWAHAVGHICQYEHLQKQIKSYLYADHYWFAPEFLLALYKKGMTLKQINDCMTQDITTLDCFKEQLIETNIVSEQEINKLFDTYIDD